MAASRSASAKIRFGFFPPSSSDTRLSIGPAAPAIHLPTAVEPVNEIVGTSGCVTSAAPARAPVPCTMISTPAGSPAWLQISPSIHAVTGVTSLGLPTHVFPVARAGATFHVNKYSGRFHGE